MAIALQYAARSDVGLVRSENQDSGYAGPNLLVVADGMGGHAAGDVASSVAIGQMVELDGDSHGADDVTTHLEQSLRRANVELQTLIRSQPELQGMGTTVTALLRTGNKLALAHIGDSRAYLLRGEALEQITHDHSFVQSLVDEGRITAEEADTHPQRSLVTRVLTGQDDDEPDVSIREARVGDRYLICSDGLSGFVARDTIAEVLGDGGAPSSTADRLVQLALRAGAPDNVTVVVADVVDPGSSPPPSTSPQVVGAAAIKRGGTRAIPVSPAEKAAALTREATGTEDDDAAAVPLAEEGRSSGVGRTLRVVAATVLAVVVLGGGAYAAYDWTQRQYFVGEQDGRVALYRGVAQDVGPVSLHSVYSTTDIELVDLPDFYRNRVKDTVSVNDLSDADALISDLRTEALICRTRKANGDDCGNGTLGGGATGSATSTGTGTGTATGSGTGTPTGTSSSTPGQLPTSTATGGTPGPGSTPTTPPPR